MREELNARYRQAAEEFAKKVVAELGDQVDSIVLYGSVARGEAREDSDIDVLVISPDPEAIRNQISDVRGDFNHETGYEFLISLAQYSRDRLTKTRERGSPFIEEVLHDGIILYDNGIFSRLREKAAAVG